MKLSVSKWLALAAVVCLIGCGGGDNGNPADNGGNANHDGKLITANGEAWLMKGVSCESAIVGIILESDGGYIYISLNANGTWSTGDVRTWRTDGNKLILAKGSNETIFQYELSNDTLTLTNDDGENALFMKCGVTVGG